MVASPMAITFLVLSLLAMGWLTARERLIRLDHSLAFHVGIHQRDRRKARFYFHSVWAGLLATFASLVTLNAIANADSAPIRRILVGIAYGIGLWGVLVVSMVWTQVGKRVSEINSDGKSLVPAPEKLGR